MQFLEDMVLLELVFITILVNVVLWQVVEITVLMVHLELL
jgi:hypothetical protein